MEHNETIKVPVSDSADWRQFHMESLRRLATECGFTHCVPLEASSIRLLPEVREMCEKNTCHEYGRTWVCPPGIGTLEECAARIGRYTWGILIQTVGSLEDPFDYDSMMAIHRAHQEHFDRMRERITPDWPGLLPLGAGGCSRCTTCTYPESPCRHRDKACGSMEGYGMVVTDVCRDNGLGYYYGRNTLAYTSGFLLE